MIPSDDPSALPNTDSKEPVVIKAFHSLKIKTGPGGFDPMNIKAAERRMESSVHLFPQVASNDIALIEDTLALVHDEMQNSHPLPPELLPDILSSVVELKAHSTMFQFPLVTQILENLLPFCLSLSTVTPLARDVIAEHLRALKIAIEQGPRAITPEDHANLLAGLEKAVAKVLRKQGE